MIHNNGYTDSKEYAVDRLRRGESRIEVCVGIGDGAVAVGYKSLRIVELIEKRRASAGDEISNEI
jgi:hypothetical protein